MAILTLTITLHEPVLATAPGGDPNTDESLPYLPGSVLRGALAHLYLREGIVDDDFMRLFLTGHTRFLNAYPVIKRQRALPIPQNWRVEKDAKPPRSIFDLLLNEVDEKPKRDERVSGFYIIQASQVHTASLSYQIAVHTRRDRVAGRATSASGDVYRYKGLAPGQTFRSYIYTTNKADAATLMTLLASGTLFLGGASTAGYGLVEVVTQQHNASYYSSDGVPTNGELVVYFESDAIVRHPQTGQTGPYVAETLTSLLPGRKLTPISSKVFNHNSWIGGFNTKWGLPLPQVWAVQKGSVWSLQTDKPITAEELAKLEQTGLGERLAEGFGCVRLNPVWQDGLQLYSSSGDATLSIKQDEEVTFPELTSAESKLIAQMNRRLAQMQLDRLLLVAIRDQAHKYRGRLSNSQLARLRLRLRTEESQTEKGFADLQKYLSGTHKRKSVDEQFRRSYVDKKTFRDWLSQFIGQWDEEFKKVGKWHPIEVWQVMKIGNHGWQEGNKVWKRPLLGNEPFQLDESLAHYYTIRLLTGVCEQITKKESV